MKIKKYFIIKDLIMKYMTLNFNRQNNWHKYCENKAKLKIIFTLI